jgi:RNA polymerase sigma-70 factor (ECF subfamily)
METATNRFVERLFLENGKQLSAFLRRRLPLSEDAADAEQEVYLRLCRMENPGDIRNPKAFLFRVASNVVVDFLRERTLLKRFFSSSALCREPESSTPLPERFLDSRHWYNAYCEALAHLSPKCRRVFLMCRLENRRHSEIAREMGISTKMVEKYMTQALSRLSEELEAFFEEMNWNR